MQLITSLPLLCLTLIALIPKSFANQPLQPQPEKCPGASALRQITLQPIDLIEKIPEHWSCCMANGFPYHVDGTWGTRDLIGGLNTDNKWSFMLRDVNANHIEQALAKSQNQLATVTWRSGPHSYMGKWYCEYDTASGGFITSLLQ